MEWSTNEPPSRSLSLAKSTALTNGTAVSSSRSTSTENLYFFFFIMKAISPLRPGHRTLMPVACNVQVPEPAASEDFEGLPTVAPNYFTSSRDLNFDSTTDDFDLSIHSRSTLQLPVVRISLIITLRTCQSHRLAFRKEIHSRLFNYGKYNRSEER